jgi:hypothetical protein
VRRPRHRQERRCRNESPCQFPPHSASQSLADVNVSRTQSLRADAPANVDGEIDGHVHQAG